MDRRSFLRILAAGLVAPIVEPQVKYFLAPLGGWRKPTFPQLMEPGLKQIFSDFLTEKRYIPLTYSLGFKVSKELIVDTEPINSFLKLRQEYLDKRAAETDRLILGSGYYPEKTLEELEKEIKTGFSIENYMYEEEELE